MEAFCNMLLSVFPDLDHINDQLEEIKYAKQEETEEIVSWLLRQALQLVQNIRFPLLMT